MRGWYQGNFKNIVEAVEILGKYLMTAYPTDTFTETGEKSYRTFVLYVKKTNEYGFDQNIKCKVFKAYDWDATDEERREIIKRVEKYSFAINP